MNQVMAVALSGGVDSAVAAVLLRERWQRLVGATHFIWPDSRCCNLTVFKRAEFLARQLSIPYYVIDVQQAFRGAVVDEFINAYIGGTTPNPCVLCNERIRFTLFFTELEKKLKTETLLAPDEELLLGTGHYARIELGTDGRPVLKKGRDPVKDQSYMLYRLPSHILSRLAFPLGDMLKSEVMALARDRGMRVADQAESQDACFVDGNYIDFIVQDTGRSSLHSAGEIVDTAGRVRGRHSGYIGYTVGQRRGLGLGDGPWYVAGIHPEKNRVIVGREMEARRREFTFCNTNWFFPPPKAILNCAAKIRYQTGENDCRVEPLGDDRFRAELSVPEFITPGQSAVLYDGDVVLGGGIIERYDT
jgi:tRNA-specific 2-thiouridylase